MPYQPHPPPSLAGQVLAAAPAMLDPNFNQTLVYLAEHTAEGALGLIMNRPLGRTLGEIASAPAVPAAVRQAPVLLGGPVQSTALLVAVFSRGRTDEDVRCTLHPAPDTLADLAGGSGCWVRAFVGYAGWGRGQLERELRENAWGICPPHTVLLDENCLPNLWSVFRNTDQRWRKLFSRLPRDPELN